MLSPSSSHTLSPSSSLLVPTSSSLLAPPSSSLLIQPSSSPFARAPSSSFSFAAIVVVLPSRHPAVVLVVVMLAVANAAQDEHGWRALLCGIAHRSDTLPQSIRRAHATSCRIDGEALRAYGHTRVHRVMGSIQVALDFR
mmetsp:Transcript_26698/g.51795  ORF Transcript_26698/g.51795 Transcript_26698/m.51795 type:complete len:140 (+) Transcript_26698:662-1081(+)